MMQNGYKRLLQRVGILWIVIGSIDLIYFIYTAANGASKSLDWNVLAIVIGILLIKGNVKVARWMGTAAAFLLIGLLGYFLTTLLLRPLELWQIHLRLYPVYVIYFIVINTLLIIALSLTYHQLRHRVVLQTCATDGMNTKFPKIAFGLFIGLIISSSVLMHSTLYGADAVEAKRLAQKQLGERYAYHVSGMRWSGELVTANITAYSTDEIRYTTVNWDKKKINR